MDINSPELGFSVNTSELEKGSAELSNISKAAGETGKSVDTLNQKFVGLGSSVGSGGTFKGVGDQFATMASGIASANKAAETTSQTFTSMGQSIAAALAKSAISFDDMKKSIASANGAFEDHAQAAGKASAPVEALAKAHGGLDTQAQAAFHSVRSFVEQLAMGIPITQAATSEFNHLSYAATGEGGISGAFTRAATAIGGMLSPVKVISAGVVGAAAAAIYLGNSWQEAAGEVDRALTGIGQRSGTTATDISNFTKANASATGLSVSQARDAALEFTKTGSVAISGLKGVGDAIKGFSLLTGKDAAEATKTFASALSGDLVKGIQEIDQRYGALDSATTEYIRTLVDQGDKTKALQVYIEAIAPANKRAEESVTTLTKAWQAFKNVASDVVSAPVGPSLDEQLKAAQARLDDAKSKPAGIGAFFSLEGVDNVKQLEQLVDQLQEKVNGFKAGNVTAQLNAISTAGDAVVKSILPQIDEIKKLDSALNTLNDARNTPGVNRSLGQDDAAAAVLEHQKALQQESLDTTVRQAEVVNQLQAAYGGVSAQTALTLNNLQSQLLVAQQVTAAGQMKAQSEATYNNLLAQGVKDAEAELIATQQLEVARAAATSAVDKQIESLRDSTEMIRAQQTGTEGVTAAAIAYKNAIEAGASATSAAALAAATLDNNMERAASAAQQMAQSAAQSEIANNMRAQGIDPQTGYYIPSALGHSQFAPSEFAGYSSTGETTAQMRVHELLSMQAALQSVGVQDKASSAYASGGFAAALKAIAEAPNTTGADPSQAAIDKLHGYDDYAIYGPTQSNIGNKISAYDQLIQLMNTGADKNTQANNLQGEIGFLNTLPQSIERDQKISQLQQSIDQLKTSTDALTSTNQELLSPYYSQDPRTSHIGFRTQGMATGGEFTVPGGYSANDNMTGIIPLASGETVSVRRPGESASGTPAPKNVTINQTFMVPPGTNVDQFGRTAYQAAQSANRTLQWASK